jgi:hypothetical protein
VFAQGSFEMDPSVPIWEVYFNGHGTVGHSHRVGGILVVNFTRGCMSSEFPLSLPNYLLGF